MRTQFDSRAFLESVLSEQLSADIFRTRLAALTDYQQMQVLLRLLSLWRLDEKEQRREAEKRTVPTDETEGAAEFDEEDDDFAVSENMQRVLDLISGAARNDAV